MSDNIKRSVGGISLCVALLAVLQVLRFALKSVVFLFIEQTKFNDRIASMAAMIILTVAVILYAHIRKIPLTLFPARFGTMYIAVTAAAILLFAITPFVTEGEMVLRISLLVYSAIITPVFEELVFRSVIWNKLNSIFKKEWITYIADTLLFSLWHLGYIDSYLLRTADGNLANMLFWKAVTGLCFGIVLGVVRLKAKNTYITILAHGVMNVLGR